MEVFGTSGGRWTETYYAPAAADLAVLDRLEPGCPPDRVPWERFRAELIAAPAALLRQRDWRRVPAASLLMMIERLRSRLAADEDASRGIAEPEAPRATPRRCTERSRERTLAGEVLLEAWSDSGEGAAQFPGYKALQDAAMRRHGVKISKDHLSRARKDLGELGGPIGQWVNPRRLSPVRVDEPEPTPGEIEECRTWFMAHSKYQLKRVFERVNELTPQAWKALAAQPEEQWEEVMKQFAKEAAVGIR